MFWSNVDTRNTSNVSNFNNPENLQTLEILGSSNKKCKVLVSKQNGELLRDNIKSHLNNIEEKNRTLISKEVDKFKEEVKEIIEKNKYQMFLENFKKNETNLRNSITDVSINLENINASNFSEKLNKILENGNNITDNLNSTKVELNKLLESSPFKNLFNKYNNELKNIERKISQEKNTDIDANINCKIYIKNEANPIDGKITKILLKSRKLEVKYKNEKNKDVTIEIQIYDLCITDEGNKLIGTGGSLLRKKRNIQNKNRKSEFVLGPEAKKICE
jgi:hypothetical protein